jgi:hypothetical protein
MFQKITNFIKYNNAFTIIVMAVFLGGGMSFAASPDLRDSVYSSSERLTSIDNSAILSENLSSFNFDLKINSITDDKDNYYVAYSYQTLAVQDGAWSNVNLSKTLKVAKDALDGKDLGLFVAGELSENVNYELSYLKRVQELEKAKGESNKVITTEYAGLIGKMIDPKEEVINGYNPVIPELVIDANREVKDIPAPVSVATPTSEPVSASASTNQSQLDEAAIRKIVEEMLANSNGAPTSEPTPKPTPTPEPTPEPTPAPDPVPTPEPTLIPTPGPTPEIAPEVTPVTESTPAPEVTASPDPVTPASNE